MVQDKGHLVHSHPANELTEKLFGFESVLIKTKNVKATTTTVSVDSDPVPEGKIWKITHIRAYNASGDIATEFFIRLCIPAQIYFYRKAGTTAEDDTINLDIELYLSAEDYIKATFKGVASGETCYLNIFGYEMNAP